MANQFSLSAWLAHNVVRGDAVTRRIDQGVGEAYLREYGFDRLLSDGVASWFDVVKCLTYPIEQLSRSDVGFVNGRVPEGTDGFTAVVASTPRLRNASTLIYADLNRIAGATTPKALPVNETTGNYVTITATLTSDKANVIYALSGLNAVGVAAGEVYQGFVFDPEATGLLELRLSIVAS